MKAEHRKELEANVLADQMGKLVQKMKSPQSSLGFVWGILVLVIALLGIYWFQRFNAVGPAEWVSLNENVTRSEFTKIRELAADNPGTVLSRSARFQLARSYLENNLDRIYIAEDRERALTFICEARAGFERLATECADEPLLYQEALMGAARSEEALIGVSEKEMPSKPRRRVEDPAAYEPGNLTRAVALYQTLANLESKYPDSYLVKQAKTRIEELKNGDDVIAFYQAMNKGFAKKDSKSDDPTSP